MPKIAFTGQENRKFELIPDQDAILTITKSGASISTKRDEQIEITVEARNKDGELLGSFTDWLTFSDKMLWKIDTFISCVGFPATKGQEVELTPENVLGRCGWGRVGTFTTAAGKTYNTVKIWYTDRAKITPPEPTGFQVFKTEAECEDEIPF